MNVLPRTSGDNLSKCGGLGTFSGPRCHRRRLTPSSQMAAWQAGGRLLRQKCRVSTRPRTKHSEKRALGSLSSPGWSHPCLSLSSGDGWWLWAIKWLIVTPFKEGLIPLAGICTPTEPPCRPAVSPTGEEMRQDWNILDCQADIFPSGTVACHLVTSCR